MKKPPVPRSSPAHPPSTAILPRRSPVAGAERLLLVLTVLATVGREITFAELKDKTGLAQSTLYRQLGLLRHWGFVVQHGGDYVPGPMCVPLAWSFDHFSYLIQESQEAMNRMRDESGESIGLLAAVGTRAICLETVESARLLRCTLTKGRSVPLRSGASAKALLAFMHLDRQKEVLGENVRSGLLPEGQRADFERELRGIRRRGYAISDSEVDAGIWGVSAPILPGAAVHADSVITLMAPISRVTGHEERFQEIILLGAQQISLSLRATNG